MTYLNPDRMSSAARLRVHRWLQINGITDLVALDPVLIAGKTIHYNSFGRNMRRLRLLPDGTVASYARRARLRVPLSAVD